MHPLRITVQRCLTMHGSYVGAPKGVVPCSAACRLAQSGYVAAIRASDGSWRKDKQPGSGKGGGGVLGAYRPTGGGRGRETLARNPGLARAAVSWLARYSRYGHLRAGRPAVEEVMSVWQRPDLVIYAPAHVPSNPGCRYGDEFTSPRPSLALPRAGDRPRSGDVDVVPCWLG